jgi:hypothetical protein
MSWRPVMMISKNLVRNSLVQREGREAARFELVFRKLGSLPDAERDF